jgi:hypothetical protein
MSYKKQLLAMSYLRIHYPAEVAQLDSFTDKDSLDKFWSNARGPEGSKALRRVARYAAVRSIQSQVSSPAHVSTNKLVEDSVAERIWHAIIVVGKIDRKSKRLIESHGYLGAMVEQLKPISKVCAGNFQKLRAAGSIDCTSEYCVWKWGQHLASPDVNKKLAILAQQYNFQ